MELADQDGCRDINAYLSAMDPKDLTLWMARDEIISDATARAGRPEMKTPEEFEQNAENVFAVNHS